MNNVSSAESYSGSQQFKNLCQAFVEQMTYGHQGVYPTAIAAWNQQQNKAISGTDGIQPGDLVYFGADKSNGGFGHAGIYEGNGNFVSATDSGVQSNNLDQWQKGTGQKLLGYVPQGGSAQALGNQAQQATEQQQQPADQPVYNVAGEMAGFRQAWNATHQTPLQAYL